MIRMRGLNIYVDPTVNFVGDAEVGHCSALGYDDGTMHEPGITTIGHNTKVGAYSIIEKNCYIGNAVEVGNYCTIYEDVYIGDNVKVLSGSRVYWGAKVGDGAIINALISANVIVEENVRFFGRIAHSHRDHTLDWESTVEASPIFRQGCFVGLGALIVGSITIGERAYVAAGEVLRFDLPPDTIFYKNRIYDKKIFRGLII